MRFIGEFSFLSNFYNCQVRWEGISFKNAEACYQAMKCEHESDRVRFCDLTGADAKKLGRTVVAKYSVAFPRTRISWMCETVSLKFHQNPHLAEKLRNIPPEDLIEHNTWHDNFWGSCVCPGCRTFAKGNNLGRVLRAVRAAIMNEKLTVEKWTQTWLDLQDRVGRIQ